MLHGLCGGEIKNTDVVRGDTVEHSSVLEDPLRTPMPRKERRRYEDRRDQDTRGTEHGKGALTSNYLIRVRQPEAQKCRGNCKNVAGKERKAEFIQQIATQKSSWKHS